MKILYSETINIDKDVHDEWLTWMKEVHIPEMFTTGLFEEKRVLRLLNEDENNGVTYSFQFVLRNRKDLLRYQQEFENHFRSVLYHRYTNKLVDFVTVLEVIE